MKYPHSTIHAVDEVLTLGVHLNESDHSANNRREHQKPAHILVCA